MACGTPFLMYAPKDMVETHIAQKNDCAFVVTDNEKLVETLKIALFDLEAREKQVENAISTSQRLFNTEINVETFNKSLEAATRS